MGRKGPRAKTKIVLKSVKQWEQLGNMLNLKFQTFLNKNHPTNGQGFLGVGLSICCTLQGLNTHIHHLTNQNQKT